jgi:hypothetical protein
MTETITIPNKMVNRAVAEEVMSSKHLVLTPRGTDAFEDLRDDDHLTHFTYVESVEHDTNHGDYEMIMVIRRDSDEKLFGANYFVAMNPDLYYDKDFPGEDTDLVEFKELSVKEKVVVTRDYTYVA